jgi:hypothetical protein
MPKGEKTDFEPGHELSLQHGAYSPREIAKRAEHVREELLIYAPYLDEPRFYPAVHRYLTACAREQLAHDAVMERGIEAKGGTRLLEVATAAARLASKLGSELGLDPIGHARIRSLSAGADSSEAAAGLADLAAVGRRARLAAEQRPAIDATAEDIDDADVFDDEVSDLTLDELIERQETDD